MSSFFTINNVIYASTNNGLRSHFSDLNTVSYS